MAENQWCVSVASYNGRSSKLRRTSVDIDVNIDVNVDIDVDIDVDVHLRVDVDGFKPADAKRLLSISKALNARTAPAGEVMARMVRAADADAASPRATFGRDLVDYLRGLPRTPRDGDEPPPKRPKTD